MAILAQVVGATIVKRGGSSFSGPAMIHPTGVIRHSEVGGMAWQFGPIADIAHGSNHASYNREIGKRFWGLNFSRCPRS